MSVNNGAINVVRMIEIAQIFNSVVLMLHLAPPTS